MFTVIVERMNLNSYVVLKRVKGSKLGGGNEAYDPLDPLVSCDIGIK